MNLLREMERVLGYWRRGEPTPEGRRAWALAGYPDVGP